MFSPSGFSENGRSLAVLEINKGYRIADVATGGFDESSPPFKGYVVSASGRPLAVFAGATLTTYDAVSGHDVASFKVNFVRASGISTAISADKKQLLVAGDNGGLDVIDADSGDVIRRLNCTKVSSVCFSKDTKTIIAVGRDIYRWSRDDFRELAHFKGKPSENWWIQRISPDERFAAGIFETRDVILRDLNSGGEIGKLPELSNDEPQGLDFSHDGKMLAVAYGGTAIVVWDVQSLIALHPK